MPFTPAHTAIVLPFINRRFFSATALIIGSIAPDFEYFFKMGVNSFHSHSIPGLFYFDLPVVIALSFVFHLIVKRNLLKNSPAFIQQRFQPLLLLDFKTYFKNHIWIFLFSALLGSASHIFWDSFTHGDRYFARILWFYKGTYVPYDGVNYPLFYALQHISTGVGLSVLILFVLLKKNEPLARVYQPKRKYWICFFLVIVLTMLTRFYFFPKDLDLGNAVVSLISSICLGLIVCGLIPCRNQPARNQTDTGS